MSGWIRPIAAYLAIAAAALGRASAADLHATLTDAQKQYEQGRFDQALKLYTQADEAEPGHAAIEYNLGLCLLGLGDGEKAVRRFESVATRGDVSRSLRRDAFFNLGLIRAESARQKLRDLLAPATQPTDRKPPPDDPANVDKLSAIADELLRAIAGFRESARIEPDADAEHNIRAVRILRRDVLGLLKKAADARQKEDMLKDPRAYLEALILEQERQAALTRLLMLDPPKEPAVGREARRAGLRAQRKIMENAATFADHLAQFRESAASAASGGPATAPATQPAEPTPREKLYQAAARQVNAAVESQREACAFLLDDEIKPAHASQSKAREGLYQALYLFPLEPGQVLVKARLRQSGLRELVGGAKADEDWLRDPLVPEAAIPKAVAWEAEQAPIHQEQKQVGVALAMLHRQCEHVAATTRPAGEPAPPPDAPPEPMLDPELNRKLADVLAGTDDAQTRCLAAIAQRDQAATLAAQEEMLRLIDAALDLLPKTLEQKITELILRQHQLNAEVQAEAGRPSAPGAGAATAALDEIRNWATRFKSRLLGARPDKLAEAWNGRQKGIQADTSAAQAEAREKVPSGADATGSGGAPPASQPAELKGFIEAARHLAEAGNHMAAAVKGLDQVAVENSLRPASPGGPVQTGQGKALEELVKALAALKPPASRPSDDHQDQQQQQPQQQPRGADKQREIEQLDRERERAERELFQRRPRTVIKDW